MFKKTIAWFLVLSILCVTPILGKAENAFFSEVEKSCSESMFNKTAEKNCVDEKVYCNATLDDNFKDDEVLVVLNQKRSLEEWIFTTNDFPEIECLVVDEITDGSLDLIKEQDMALREFSAKKNRKISSTEDARKFVTEELASQNDVPCNFSRFVKPVRFGGGTRTVQLLFKAGGGLC